jgi:hypothetical protein
MVISANTGTTDTNIKCFEIKAYLEKNVVEAGSPGFKLTYLFFTQHMS